MKIIDIHAHFHTDRDEGALIYLKENGFILPGADGEIKGLINYMRRHGISYSLNLPVAWKPESVRPINALMKSYNAKALNVTSFGTVHPGQGKEALEAELNFLKGAGFKGIKIHPEEQGFEPDCDEMRAVYEYCSVNKMIIITHAGAGSDPAFKKEIIRSSPARIAAVMKEYPELVLIAAHMGGLNMWEEAEKHLLGENIYLDTAYTTVMPQELLKDFILRHGVEHVLYGTDYPWQDAGVIGAAVLNAVPELEKAEMIMYKNAEKLLGICL